MRSGRSSSKFPSTFSVPTSGVMRSCATWLNGASVQRQSVSKLGLTAGQRVFRCVSPLLPCPPPASSARGRPAEPGASRAASSASTLRFFSLFLCPGLSSRPRLDTCSCARRLPSHLSSLVLCLFLSDSLCFLHRWVPVGSEPPRSSPSRAEPSRANTY